MHQFSESEDHIYAVSSKTHAVADRLVLGILQGCDRPMGI